VYKTRKPLQSRENGRFCGNAHLIDNSLIADAKRDLLAYSCCCGLAGDPICINPILYMSQTALLISLKKISRAVFSCLQFLLSGAR
jgi:hypothetical protein